MYQYLSTNGMREVTQSLFKTEHRAKEESKGNIT